MKLTVVRNHTTEWSCRAGVDLEDRYAELNVTAVVTTLSGAVSRVSGLSVLVRGGSLDGALRVTRGRRSPGQDGSF